MPDSQNTFGGDLTDWVDRTDGLTPHPHADSMDSQTRQSLEDAVEARRLLKTLELPVAPPHFERRVQFKVRRRSAGRYFSAYPSAQNFIVSFDAFIVLAVAIMAACWFLIQEPVMAENAFFVDPPKSEIKSKTP